MAFDITVARPRGIDPTKSEPKATNQMSTMALYYYRLLYKVTFSQVTGRHSRFVKKNVKDFEFGEKILYGRVDNKMMPMQVQESKLVNLPVEDPATQVRVLDFVGAAFTDFKKAFRNAMANGQIKNTEGFLSVPEPKRGYIPATVYYMDYRIALFELFAEKLRNDADRNIRITDFESFVPHFEQFIKDTTNYAPFTFSGYMRSKYASIHMTGLAIDLADMIDASNDKKKMQHVFDSPNYKFYENMAMQFGFSVDKNCPWRLIADIESPAMQRYSKSQGYASFRQIMQQCYKSTYLDGYNNFKSLFTIYYNSFVIGNNSVAIPSMRKDGRYVAQRVFRQPEDLVKLNIKYGEEWFLQKYAMVRNAEEGHPLSETRVIQLVNRAYRLSKVKGKARALKLINVNLARVDEKSGSIAEKINKINNEKKQQEDLDNRNQRRPGTISY
tara:strand:+ start:360 stop:1685 length:1326 start_codon:yes stop_codon:yes gene_type:complete